MKVVDVATMKGDGPSNQDQYLVGDYYAAVFDGASAFPPEPSDRDGGWYARELAKAVQERMAPAGDLRRVLKDALEGLLREHGLTADGPSSTVALVRWDDVNLDCLVLGDSPIAVIHTDGHVDVITDPRLSAVGAQERAAYRERLNAGGGFDGEHRELLRNLQAEQRKYRNDAHGYWIAADDPDAFNHSLSRSFRIADVDAAVLMTDGASAIVDRFGLTTWADLSTSTRAQGCAQTLAEVNQVEESDPVGRTWPRSKKHDDKTVVLVG